MKYCKNCKYFPDVNPFSGELLLASCDPPFHPEEDKHVKLGWYEKGRMRVRMANPDFCKARNENNDCGYFQAKEEK